MDSILVYAATFAESRLLRGLPGRAQVVQPGPADLETARQQLLASSPAGLLSFGFAGGLAPNLPAGTILLPQRLRARDGGYRMVDVDWHRRAASQIDVAPGIESGDLLEAAGVIGTPAHKHSLHVTTGAVAVDMESVALADLASGAGIPFLALRAIIDTADDTVPSAFVAIPGRSGQLRWAPVLLAAAGHPWAMLRFTRAYQAAARALRRALHSAGDALFGHGAPAPPRRGGWTTRLAE